MTRFPKSAPGGSVLADGRTLRDLAVLLGGGGLAVLGLALAQVPAALLVGPVLVATWLGVRGTGLRIPAGPHEAAQGVAGCMIAHYLTPEIALRIVDLWPFVLVFAAMTLALACLAGLLLGRLTQVEEEEAIWGFLPGMAGAVIAMSNERGLDSRVVAFIQLVRLIAVIVVMSVVSRLMFDTTAVPPQAGGAAFHPGVLPTLALAATGPLAARCLSFLPAAATLVPLLLAALLQGGGWVDLALPGWLLFCAYFVLGAHVGLRFSPRIIRGAMAVFWPVILFSLGLMGLCGVSGMILAWLVGVDLLTGILATVPGSIETIAIIAVNAKADLSFIMTMQVIRLFAVVLAGPPIARALSRMVRRRPLALVAPPGE
ncbi:AbrB family transcriptional regulator [Paracoccus sp. YIM 132242]|uniref:AbrB family transcriptional regulator n=1 Tax=Paracoccus lichenicola TaxID=2665644 RepID=A0A6L6HQW3_9RHOB|nr:AbrB family transcriptional regulator [Paracoccus lichenicola]MTE01564.1 AbrB family transcriptional regulator [Paracoccus lichenicola]